jgi:hypothetical protein
LFQKKKEKGKKKLLVRVMIVLFGHTVCHNSWRGSLPGLRAYNLGLVFWIKAPAGSIHGLGASLGGEAIRILRRT